MGQFLHLFVYLKWTFQLNATDVKTSLFCFVFSCSLLLYFCFCCYKMQNLIIIKIIKKDQWTGIALTLVLID